MVDGGLANNVPIDVARKMGADIVIVVGFPTNLKKRNKLNSALDIVAQSLDLLIGQNSRIRLKTLGSRDIYIEPALGDSHKCLARPIRRMVDDPREDSTDG